MAGSSSRIFALFPPCSSGQGELQFHQPRRMIHLRPDNRERVAICGVGLSRFAAALLRSMDASPREVETWHGFGVHRERSAGPLLGGQESLIADLRADLVPPEPTQAVTGKDRGFMEANMRRRIFFVLLLMCTVDLARSDPTGITILSESNHVWGNAEQWLHPGDSYDITGTSGVVGLAESGYVWAYSSAGGFAAAARTQPEGGSADAFAHSAYLFRPSYPTLVVGVSADTGWVPDNTQSFESCAAWSLTDITDGVQLGGDAYHTWWDWSDVDGRWFSTHSGGGSYSVDPTHEFRLDLHALAVTGDSGREAEISASLYSPIPLLSSGALAAVGTGVVTLLRRRRML